MKAEERLKVGRLVGSNLKYYINKAGMSQQTFADKLGMSTSQLSHYVVGDRLPDLMMTKKILKGLGITFDQLVATDEEQKEIIFKETYKDARLIGLKRTVKKLEDEIKSLKKKNEELKNQKSRRVNIGDYPNANGEDYDKYKYIAQSLPYRDFKRYEADYEAHRK